MKYIGFIIENYRAIERIEVKISDPLIPIIGINESGKTSVLKGILSFDKLKDNYNKGEHLNFKNKYSYKEKQCNITARVLIETEEEVEKLAKKMKLKVGDPLVETLFDYVKNKRLINISRSLNLMEYNLIDFPIEEERNKEMADKLFDLLPIILYFDDFSDRVPETIDLPPNYIEKGIRSGNSVQAEWRSLIEEIFYRSTDGEYTIKDFLEIEDPDDKAALLSDVSDQLNADIIDEWKKLKLKGSSALANDEDDLELKIIYTPPTEEYNKYSFEFKVVDKTLNQRKRQFNVTERSKGFQWYFNFIIKLKFNAKYKDNPSNAIYLLDEPGSYLHSSAQEELLSELKVISENNTLLYCTHSQYLLDPEKINISTIKIAIKQEGNIVLKPFNSYGKNYNQGALTPLMDALHLKTGLESINTKNVIITEGITDYYFLKLLTEYREEFQKHDIQLIPGAGAQNLRELISLSIAWSSKYLVLLDNDDAGRNAYNTYISYFGEGESDNLYLYNDREETFVLEDFILDEDEKNILELTNSDNLKSAFISLYFLEDKNLRRRIIKKLDSSNLVFLSSIIDNHFKVENDQTFL
ncbi:predicted ATP-dependent endonuclease of OLD family [Bacillus oleivorans]|uniref:Predicted ATP-dependent endonuclease of OLD family n=1 Tax=Bacillus oleivorans TaxID=1448271 RepID=A0A285D4S5_9BACI|nr:AAA family ATPase [Bacillus oleivorans]SNX74318.1 predicted ATP-dependent endonuclease of OLD family [Bacillus oleivorans]